MQIRLFFVLGALLMSSLTYAQGSSATYPMDLPLSWDNAELFDDGSTLTVTDLASVFVSCVRNGDTAPVFTSTVPVRDGPGSHQAEVFVGVIPQPGNYSCVAYSITDLGIWSAPSNEALKRYTGNPNPPRNFKFEVVAP